MSENNKPSLTSEEIFNVIIADTMIRDTSLPSDKYLEKLGLGGQDENKALDRSILNLIIEIFKTVFGLESKIKFLTEQFGLLATAEEKKEIEEKNNKEKEL